MYQEKGEKGGICQEKKGEIESAEAKLFTWCKNHLRP